MDTNEGLRRFRVAQQELAAEEVEIRMRMQNTASSRRVIGLTQQQNEVHRGQRPEEDNVQIVKRFYHVKPPALIHVGNYIQPDFKARTLKSLRTESAFSNGDDDEIYRGVANPAPSDEMYKGVTNPSMSAEIALHDGIANKYKARLAPDVQPSSTERFFDAKMSSGAPSAEEQAIIDRERSRGTQTSSLVQSSTQASPETTTGETQTDETRDDAEARARAEEEARRKKAEDDEAAAALAAEQAAAAEAERKRLARAKAKAERDAALKAEEERRAAEAAKKAEQEREDAAKLAAKAKTVAEQQAAAAAVRKAEAAARAAQEAKDKAAADAAARDRVRAEQEAALKAAAERQAETVREKARLIEQRQAESDKKRAQEQARRLGGDPNALGALGRSTAQALAAQAPGQRVDPTGAAGGAADEAPPSPAQPAPPPSLPSSAPPSLAPSPGSPANISLPPSPQGLPPPQQLLGPQRPVRGQRFGDHLILMGGLKDLEKLPLDAFADTYDRLKNTIENFLELYFFPKCIPPITDADGKRMIVDNAVQNLRRFTTKATIIAELKKMIFRTFGMNQTVQLRGTQRIEPPDIDPSATKGPFSGVMGGLGKPQKRGRFEKGSQEAKDFMAALRAKRRK